MAQANRYDSFGLDGKVALVTGASEGIGRVLALGLAEAGARVALASRTRAKLEAVAAEVEAMGKEALVVPVDLRQLEQVHAMVQTVYAHFGSFDILVNNAAWRDKHSALEVTEAGWDRTIDTSLKAAFFTSQAAARIMVAQGAGKIVNIGSTLGEVTAKDRVAYAAAKGGLHHLTRALALEWAALGISVNCIAPCLTETPTRSHAFQDESFVQRLKTQMIPVGRWAQPEDLVGATLFLCSDLAGMVVGHVLMVDGGWTIH